MRDERSQGSHWRASTLRLVDDLIADLSAMHQRATVRGDPGLVDLNRALKRACKLRNRIRKKRSNKIVWQKAFEGAVYVAAVARRIYSLLSNCTHFFNGYPWPLERSYA